MKSCAIVQIPAPIALMVSCQSWLTHLSDYRLLANSTLHLHLSKHLGSQVRGYWLFDTTHIAGARALTYTVFN